MNQNLVTACAIVTVVVALFGSAKAASLDDLKKAFANDPAEISYGTQDDTRALLQGAPENGRYLAIAAKISGLDLAEASCKNEAWYKALLNLVSKTSKTATLEVSFKIGGYTTPNIPLLLIADSPDTCKAHVVRFERVTPYVRIGQDSDIKVTYYFGFGRQVDLVVLNNLIGLATKVVDIAGVSNALLSTLTSPALKAASDEFRKQLKEAAQIQYIDTQEYQFRALDKKGLRFGSTSNGAAYVELTVVSKLSINTDRRNGWTANYGAAGTNIIDDRVNPPGFADGGIYPTIRLHMAKSDAGAARYATFKAAKSGEDFSTACESLYQELYSTLGLSTYDSSAALFRLAQSARKLSLLNDNYCGGDPDISARMGDAGLNLRAGDLSPAEINLMKDNAEGLAKAFDSAVINGSTSILESALLATDVRLDLYGDFFPSTKGRIADREKVASLLASLKPEVMGCHVAVPGQIPPSMWNILFVADKKPAIAQLAFDDLKAKTPRISAVTLLPAVKSDPQVLELVRKAKTNPPASCGRVLPAFDGID